MIERVQELNATLSALSSALPEVVLFCLLAAVMLTDLFLQRSAPLVVHNVAVAGLLAAAGFPQYALAFNKAAFDAKSVADVVKALGAGAPVESKDVTLTAPDVTENGAAVTLGVATALPGVRQMLVLVEKNPSPLAAIFRVSEAVDANFTVRVKMGQTSPVYAVALMADGRALWARREVQVTVGGCGV